jgi:hypothetical protein
MARGGRGKWATTGRGGAGFPITDLNYPPVVGGVPSWVPANAKIHIDFVGGTPQGRAWCDGAEVAIETLIEDYLSSRLSPDGLTYLAPFTGPALAKALGSFTCRVQYFWPVGLTQGRLDDAFYTGEATESYALQLSLDFPLKKVQFQGFNEINLLLLNAPLQPAGGYNTYAMTLTTIGDGGRMEFAVNGSVVTSGVYDADDRPASDPFTLAFVRDGTLCIQSITFYDPLPTTAGLSALSAIS